MRVDYLAPTIYLIDIIVAMLLFLHFRTYRALLRNTTIQFFLLLLAINALFAVSKEIALYRYIKVIELLAVVAIIRDSRNNIRLFFNGLLWGAALQLFLVSGQFIRKESLEGVFYFLGERPLGLSMPGIAKASLDGAEFLRPYGTFSHPNSMGGFYLILYSYYLGHPKLFNSARYTIFGILISALIILSFSKIAVFGFVLVNFGYITYRFRDYKDCLLCLCARVMALLIPLAIVLRALTDPTSGQKRIELMNNAALIIAKYPITGVGLGNYLYAQQWLPSRYLFFFGQPVHNVFLLLFAEVGFIVGGLLIWYSFLFFRKRPYTFSLIAVIFSLLFTGTFDHYWITLQQNWLLVGVVIGLL